MSKFSWCPVHMSFVNFMRSSGGRGLRIVAGLALIALGLLVVEGTGGTILAVVGLVPLAAGIFNFCLFGPVFGVDLWPGEGRDSLIGHTATSVRPWTTGSTPRRRP